MISKKIEIVPAWSSIDDQFINGVEDNYWKISHLISAAKNLSIEDAIIRHLDIGYNIAGINIRKFLSHMMMIQKADLRYPILLDEDEVLLDGRHRIAKAILQGKTHIKMKRFDRSPPYSGNHNG